MLLLALGHGLAAVVCALARSSWGVYARVVRARTLVLREQEHMQAARALGASWLRVGLRHLLPHVLPTSLVLGTFGVAQAVLAEAALSFLGLGVGVHRSTWGAMVADGRAYLADAWWIASAPSVALAALALALTILGDEVRAGLDPRSSQRS